MKKILIILTVIIALGSAKSYAQSTPTQTVVGTQSIVNGKVVWTPIVTSNPLPTSSH